MPREPECFIIAEMFSLQPRDQKFTQGSDSAIAWHKKLTNNKAKNQTGHNVQCMCTRIYAVHLIVTRESVYLY